MRIGEMLLTAMHYLHADCVFSHCRSEGRFEFFFLKILFRHRNYPHSKGMGKVPFSQPVPGVGLFKRGVGAHLYPIILTLVPGPFQGRGYPVEERGYPSPRWGYLSPRWGIPWTGQYWVPAGQDRTGYPLARLGYPPQPGWGIPHRNSWASTWYLAVCLLRSRRMTVLYLD